MKLRGTCITAVTKVTLGDDVYKLYVLNAATKLNWVPCC